METILMKLVEIIKEPLFLFQLLALYFLWNMNTKEREERKEVQKKRDEIIELFYQQNEKMMNLLEQIRLRMK